MEVSACATFAFETGKGPRCSEVELALHIQSAQVRAQEGVVRLAPMTHPDTAVQVALLNNKGLQASYANVGLSAAEAWQESTPENPIVAIGVLGIGAAELGAYRAIEGLFRANILDAQTRKQRVLLADANFRAAQMNAVNDTLALANQTRMAWINAVAAFETVRISSVPRPLPTPGQNLRPGWARPAR